MPQNNDEFPYQLDRIVSDFKEAIADMSHLPALRPELLRVYEAIARLYQAHGDYYTAVRRLASGLSWFKRKYSSPPAISNTFCRFGTGAQNGHAYAQASQFFAWGLQTSLSRRSKGRTKRLFKLLRELVDRKI